MSERIASTHRVVVLGYGMAGSRFAEELRVRDPGHRFALTIFGAERHAAYNRVLLSDVLAGRTDPGAIALTAPGWADGAGVALRLGVTITAIDRERREVVAADGTRTPYDTLVIATGSRAFVPAIPGLDGPARPGVTVFRTLEDCHAIIEASRATRHAVVIGGGLLGLEAARGLAGRGLDVTVVHHRGHVMDRQLDSGAGAVLRSTLGALGVRVRTGVSAAAVPGGGPVTSVRLTDGTELPAGLLVLACGVRPETHLAGAAGLDVERGIVVGDDLRSASDPDVYAIGECAQHAGQVYGLVAPAWDQARVAAARISGSDPSARYAGSRVVTRLKAAGVDLAAMGEAGDESAEVIQFSDPARGTYKKVVLRDGRVTGAIMLGQIDTVGTVTQLFDRGSVAPSDRLSLLFGDRAAPAPAHSPALMPSAATVCQCNGVTKGQITACVLAGAVSVAEVATATRATTGCGGCRDTVEGITAWLASAEPPSRNEVTA
jgi:assimilatory nitrate reductase electron transfer subunit